MIMGLGVGDETAVEILGSAPVITMLLPLVLSHVGRVAMTDPRVRSSFFYLTFSILSALFLREKMNHFLLKMHQIRHVGFCITILTRKLTKIFLLNIQIYNY